MRICGIERCRPGMVLAEPIYNSDGRVLLGTGIQLSGTMIDRLKRAGIPFVYIKDSQLEDVHHSHTISHDTLVRGMATVKRALEGDLSAVKQRLNLRAIGKEMESLFTDVYDEIRSQPNLRLTMTDLYVKDAYTYTHGFQVSIYAITLGIRMGLSKQQLLQLGVGSMLLDIGMRHVPREIVQKPGQLTAEELAEIYKHPVYGYQIILNEMELPLLSAHVSLQHHERLDGKGYPRGLKGPDIHPFGKIAAIADCYDALVSQRAYRKAFLPHEALELLYTEAGKHFETDYLLLFRETITFYPVGLTVVLDRGERGVVVSNDVPISTRPLVRVLEDPQGGKNVPYDLNLSEDLSRQIVSAEL